MLNCIHELFFKIEVKISSLLRSILSTFCVIIELSRLSDSLENLNLFLLPSGTWALASGAMFSRVRSQFDPHPVPYTCGLVPHLN